MPFEENMQHVIARALDLTSHFDINNDRAAKIINLLKESDIALIDVAAFRKNDTTRLDHADDFDALVEIVNALASTLDVALLSDSETKKKKHCEVLLPALTNFIENVANENLFYKSRIVRESKSGSNEILVQSRCYENRSYAGMGA